MAFRLELESLRGVGDAFAAVVPAVDAGVRATPDLADREIRVNLRAVEIHRHERLLGPLPVLETRGAEVDVVGVPLSEAVEGVVGRFTFVDDRTEAVLGLVAFLDLDLVAVLEIDTGIALRVHDVELHVQPEIAVGLLGDDVRRAVFASGCGGIIRLDDSAPVNRISDDLPLDRQRRCETRPLPVGPLRIEHLAAAVEDHLGSGLGTGSDADVGLGRNGAAGKDGSDGGDKEKRGVLHGMDWVLADAAMDDSGK